MAANQRSIHYLTQGVAVGIGAYLDGVFQQEMGVPMLQGVALNSEYGNTEDDFRRILEVNKSTGAGDATAGVVTNKQVLPFLVMAMTAGDATTLPLSMPRDNRYPYLSDDQTQSGTYRLVDLVMRGRVYVTTAFQSLDLWDCMKLHESKTFMTNYAIPWLPTAASPSAQIRFVSSGVAKYSGLDGVGQLFGLELEAQVKGNLYSNPAAALIVEQVNLKFYDWLQSEPDPVNNSVLMDTVAVTS